MNCPVCGQPDTRVIDSRPAEGGASLRRRRQCDLCDHRFTTHERVALPAVYVIKKDGRREEFDRDKLLNGVSKACNKRPVSIDDIDRLLSDVEIAVRQDGKNEVDSVTVGELVMERLFQLDQVAYVRFASVYQRFDDVKRFAQLLERMSRHAKRPTRGEALPQADVLEDTPFPSTAATKDDANTLEETSDKPAAVKNDGRTASREETR